MSSSLNELVIEPNIRYFGKGGALLYINNDDSWSVGLNTRTLVNVHFGSYTEITDETFGYSAVSIEKSSSGSGYRLFVRSDADNSQIIEVAVDATGKVDSESISSLTREQMYQIEVSSGVDLDNNEGLGDAPVLIEGGEVNLYISADGIYQLGTDSAQLINITVGGQPLTSKILPPNSEIIEVVSTEAGFDVFVELGNGDIFNAKLNAQGEYIGGINIDQEQVNSVEIASGLDINGNSDLPAPVGWTNVLKDSFIKSAVESATAINGKMSYTQLVAMMNELIQAHKTNGDAPLSANELTDLQVLAAHGKNVFAGASDSATDYLSHIFSKLVDGSVANAFYTGGQEAPVALGNLAANSPVTTLEKLVGKWLLGDDLPTASAGGDSATGEASTTVAAYAKTSGTLFVDGVAPEDIKQGALGDCYFMASLVTIADVKPNAIASAVVDNGTINGTHTWGVRFYDAEGKGNWVTVNDMLPVLSSDDPGLVFGRNPAHDLNGEIWVPLLEKAYVQVNMAEILPRGEKSGVNAYWAIEGGFGDPIPELLGGGKINGYLYHNYNWDSNPYIINNVVDRNDPAALASLQDIVTKAMNNGKPIWISSSDKTTDSYSNTLLTGGHAFSAQDANKANETSTDMSVYNPWGIKILPNPPENVGYLSPFPESIDELISMPGVNFWIGV